MPREWCLWSEQSERVVGWARGLLGAFPLTRPRAGTVLCKAATRVSGFIGYGAALPGCLGAPAISGLT